MAVKCDHIKAELTDGAKVLSISDFTHCPCCGHIMCGKCNDLGYLCPRCEADAEKVKRKFGLYNPRDK